MMIYLVSMGVIMAISLAILARFSYLSIVSIEDLIELSGLNEAAAGFIILSVMTSIPEMTVAAFSILQGSPGISIGDLLGSNMFNIGMVVGLIAMVSPLKRVRSDFLVEIADILFFSSAVPIVLAVPFFSTSLETIGHLIGMILIVIFIFSVYTMAKARKVPYNSLQEGVESKDRKTVLIKVIVGISIVIVSSRFVVWSASNIAAILGIPPILIGAKIIAIGTSLPELALDMAAVRRGRINLALGDIIGSNLTNMTLVLGIVLIASPLTVNLTVFTEILPFLLIMTLLLWRFLLKGQIPKWGGILLIMMYIIFQATLTVP